MDKEPRVPLSREDFKKRLVVQLIAKKASATQNPQRKRPRLASMSA